MPDLPTARLEISLSAILANYRTLQARAPAAEIAPVVKADAYGLGMAEIAPYLAHHGAQTFFVARLEEGIALRKMLAREHVIYVLDGLGDGQTAIFNGLNLRPVLNSPSQYQQWISGPDSLKAALHIDTGMNRLGVRVDDLAALPESDGRQLSLVMSHLACGDEAGHPLNAEQLTAFRKAAQRFSDVPKSLANTAGAFLGEDYACDIVRPGIGLYGGGPFGVAHPGIRAVATLKARVMQVRNLRAGETVGYGATFVAPQDMTLATIGLGYADGLLRSFSQGFATVAGHRRRLTGRVSMDVFTMDVTELDVATGDWVELLGPAQNIDEVAAGAGTIGYELLTRLSNRIPRLYNDASYIS